ncbi:MAG: hypothetical protein WC284_08425 [Candidimonas sp.]
MGRPLNKRFFGDPSEGGVQINLTEAWIPGAGSLTAAAWIVKQTGNGRYVVTDGADTGVVNLVDTSPVVEGQARIEITIYGGGTENAKQINSHQVKTFDGNVYRWLPTGAIADGDADLPLS